ncbi:MAG: hypothetical protein QOG62_2393 [Thermoleophilaceae bacterium]|nr:hypothetical protein [Thermoleophilaceae bacterium]
MVVLVSAGIASFLGVPPGPAGPGGAPPPTTSPTTTDESKRTEPKPRTDDAPAARDEDADHVDIEVGDQPGRITFPPNRHLVVTVSSKEAGQIAISGLGRVAPVLPRTPAMFDLFTDRLGQFPIVFTPVEGGDEIPVGTLVVEKERRAPPATQKEGRARPRA